MATEREADETVGFNRPDAEALLNLIGIGITVKPKTPRYSYGRAIMKVTTAITAKSGTSVVTAGKGKACYHFLDKDSKITIVPEAIEDVYNLSSATAAVGTVIFCIREDLSRNLIWIYEDCDG